MNEKKRYLLMNTAILTVSNFATKLLGFFLIPLYTGVLTTAEYGTYDIINSTVGLIFPILTLNIVDAVMRFAMDKDISKNDIGRISLKYIVGSWFVVLLLLMIINYMGWFSDIHGYLRYAFFYYVTSSLLSYLIQYAKGCEQVKDMGIAGVINSACAIGLNIFFLVVLRIGLPGFFLASILSQLLTCIYYIIRLNFISKIIHGKRNISLEKDMIRYSVPLIATALSWWVNGALDKYVVIFVCGISANGLLSIAYKLPNMINMLQNIFTQAWQISAVKEYGGKDTPSFYGNTFSFINTLMCAACAWFIILSRPLAGILFANEFYSAWQFVPFLLISSVINCASGLLGPILSAQKNTKALMWSAIIGAGANTVFNVVLVWLMGIQGATIATLISSFVIYVIRKKAVSTEIKIDNYSVVLITWCLLSVQAVIEVMCAGYVFEICLMIVMFILNFKNLKKILGNILKIKSVLKAKNK